LETLNGKGCLPADTYWEFNWDAIDEVTSKMLQLFKLWMAKHKKHMFWYWAENERCGDFGTMTGSYVALQVHN